MISSIHPIPGFSDTHLDSHVLWQPKRDEGIPTLPSSVDLELVTNLFLRCLNPAAIKSAESKLGRNPENEVGVFAALRSWKDNF